MDRGAQAIMVVHQLVKCTYKNAWECDLIELCGHSLLDIGLGIHITFTVLREGKFTLTVVNGIALCK